MCPTACSGEKESDRPEPKPSPPGSDPRAPPVSAKSSSSTQILKLLESQQVEGNEQEAESSPEY
ncbi:hypothetical protein EYF80_010157 [Liparis tanakae]|uniref:Uncharacterized protein n=1 Tax=Liparis tanakae TaxID=230148 RepID=A0A4Z2INV0_9TELE|nr:hypothetical protein EYF80_010157 [Liparis tanakae]